MNRSRQRIYAVVCLSLVSLLIWAWTNAAFAVSKKTVAIISFDAHNQRYAATQKALIDQVRKDGYSDAKIAWLLEDAAGKKDKATELAKRFMR